MLDVWIYSIISVVIVSLISFIGVVAIPLKLAKRRSFLLFLISFSIGALLGDSFIHILPEVVREFGFVFEISFFALAGFLLFFVIEKIIHWKHSHTYGLYRERSMRRKSIAVINLIGDGVHNLIDGIIIGVSYLVSLPLGVATTIAVVFHEIPQEMGDFGVLIYGGISKTKALFFNFLSALAALVGVVITLLLGTVVSNYSIVFLPVAAGGFVYIAGSNLVPELHKEIRLRESLLQVIGISLGIAVMIALLYV